MFVGNKAKKGQISKRVFQENKAHQIFRKTNISYPLIRTRTCAYQGVRNVRFSENLTCFVFLKHPFWDLPFCLATDVFIYWKILKTIYVIQQYLLTNFVWKVVKLPKLITRCFRWKWKGPSPSKRGLEINT